MEKVQFQLESTLPELKDFHDKGLFTKNEIDQITRRRTVFETSLIRRHTRKDDFFKYAEYEINLERLRKVRWKKLGYHINPPPPSASSYSLPRRAIYILKRATVKFPGDLAVWLAYVEYASREGMRKIVSKGLTLALQHHPLSPTLYLLLSYHHLHPNSPFPREVIPSASTLDLPSTSSSKDTGFSLEGTAAARTQLLLGLRLIPDSEILWMEYIKLELGWVEALRRRWNVLGINDAIDSPDSNEVNAERMTGGEGSFGPDGEDARKSILAGQLVLHAIRSALGAIEGQKGMTFRLDLVRMLRTYPSALRGKALDAVHEDLGRIAEGSDMKLAAQARLAGLTRGLYERKYVPGETDNALEGVELVEELGRIAKEIRKNAKEGSEFLEVAGEWLGEQIEAQKDNEDLREYLLSVLSSLTAAKYNPPPSLLSLHLDLMEDFGTNDDLLTVARSHAAQYPSNASLQLFRVEQEVHEGDPSALWEIFEKTVRRVSPKEAENDEAEVRKIWFTWTSTEEKKHETAGTNADGVWAAILGLSAKINQPMTHSALLGRYFISTQQRSSPLPPLKVIDEFAKYRPTDDFFTIAFVAVSIYSKSPYQDLAGMYERRRSAARVKEARIQAALDWAEWLLTHRKALDASKIIDSVQREDEGAVERRWKDICDRAETAAAAGDAEMDLERALGAKGWAGLSTPDGVLVHGEDDEEEEDEGDDEEGEEDDDAMDEDERDGDSEDEEMETAS